jgi:hypothetical protein
MRNVAYFETGAAELSVLHESSCGDENIPLLDLTLPL